MQLANRNDFIYFLSVDFNHKNKKIGCYLKTRKLAVVAVIYK